MSYGRLWTIKATSSGYGWRWTQTPVRLSLSILVQEMRHPPASCGSRYLLCIDQAIVYTDFWTAYAAVLPAKRHRTVGKDTGKTSYVERFNNTLRQRVSRLVRKTLSFSKSLENHIGAIWYFIHAYNKSLLL